TAFPNCYTSGNFLNADLLLGQGKFLGAIYPFPWFCRPAPVVFSPFSCICTWWPKQKVLSSLPSDEIFFKGNNLFYCQTFYILWNPFKSSARVREYHFPEVVLCSYRILSFPRNLINARDTRKGLAAAFRMWSEVSPFSFREVPRHVASDLKIGFYSINHTDCLESLIHHCFDGTTGELAHAFFPPNGEIHFDDHEYWILGNTRFSWKKGVWLTDLVHVAAHEIGHALGLMHSLNPNALMHINATLTGKKTISQDEVWGIHRLYGCKDRLFMCPSWAQKGFCEKRRKLMKKHCPSTCDFCYEFPFPTVPPTLPPPRTKTKTVSEGRNVTFRCGQKIIHKKGKVYWYKDKELLEYSYPGYLSLNEDHMSIIANAINEGTYTCIVKKKERILTTYSWRIRLKH
uniref:Matrix metalloproteinase-23 n=1 Tax=Buteo japonicus TaxID=224669 RepID=A0A8C0AUV0_9AVES